MAGAIIEAGEGLVEAAPEIEQGLGSLAREFEGGEGRVIERGGPERGGHEVEEPKEPRTGEDRAPTRPNREEASAGRNAEADERAGADRAAQEHQGVVQHEQNTGERVWERVNQAVNDYMLISSIQDILAKGNQPAAPVQDSTGPSPQTNQPSEPPVDPKILELFTECTAGAKVYQTTNSNWGTFIHNNQNNSDSFGSIDVGYGPSPVFDLFLHGVDSASGEWQTKVSPLILSASNKAKSTSLTLEDVQALQAAILPVLNSMLALAKKTDGPPMAKMVTAGLVSDTNNLQTAINGFHAAPNV